MDEGIEIKSEMNDIENKTKWRDKTKTSSQKRPVKDTTFWQVW